MAGNTWSQSPSGVWKNHAMSRNFRRAAIEDTVMMMHTKPEDGFGRKQGESVTISRMSRPVEPTFGQLVEGEPTPEYTVSQSTSAITVNEFGGAVPFTSLYDDFSEFDMYNEIQQWLMKQMSLVLDTMVATAAKTSLLKYAITGVTSSNVTTNGTFGATSTAGLNMYHVEAIYDLLYDTYAAPETPGGGYTAICRQRALRSLMNDPDWIRWHEYTDPQAKFNGEVGTVNDVRFIKTNHAAALGNVGSSNVLGECLFMGGDAVAYVEAFPPELRAGVPQDGGRQQSMLWYGICQAGLVFPTANAGEARLIHVGSA